MSEAVRLFISYSHADASWLRRLQRHLKPLSNIEKIELWDDTSLVPGQDWRTEIRDRLDWADAVICLISADFFASDFIPTEELAAARTSDAEVGVELYMLNVAPSRFQRDPLGVFQIFNKTPLVMMSEGEQEATLDRLAESIELFRPVRDR